MYGGTQPLLTVNACAAGRRSPSEDVGPHGLDSVCVLVTLRLTAAMEVTSITVDVPSV